MKIASTPVSSIDDSAKSVFQSPDVPCERTYLETVDGKYTLDVETGLVTFLPNQGFTGFVTEPVRYTIVDADGRVAFAYIKPFVEPQGPVLAETGQNLPWGIICLAIGLMIAGLVLRRKNAQPR
jgi:hypothetical protein